jgi:hypothetical protein
MLIGLTLGAGALIGLAQPMVAVAHPDISWRAPAAGATISGVVATGPDCAVHVDQTTSMVDFYIDGRHIKKEFNAPWNCPFDSRDFSDGAHTLSATASDDGGHTTSSSVQIKIANGAGSAPSVKSTLRGVGSAPLSDQEAASRVRPFSYEHKPGNATANRTTPTRTQLDNYYAANYWDGCEWRRDRVTGNFTGTTDEIIQWAAHKWGLDEDVMRAVAHKESTWRQSMIGDNGTSYGMMQVKSTVHRRTYPLSQNSTAFNVDFYAAMQRYYFDGCATWLLDFGSYRSGDMWGSVGAWFSGRWHNSGAESYISAVKSQLANRAWGKPGF